MRKNRIMKKAKKFFSVFLSLAILVTTFSTVLPSLKAKADNCYTLTIKSNISGTGLSYTPLSGTYDMSGVTVDSNGTMTMALTSNNTLDIYFDEPGDSSAGITYNSKYTFLGWKITIGSVTYGPILVKSVDNRTHLKDQWGDLFNSLDDSYNFLDPLYLSMYGTVKGDVTIEAVFADPNAATYSITVGSSDTSQGTVKSDFLGNTDTGSTYKLTATPTDGYAFDHWEWIDSSNQKHTSSDNPLTSTITENTSVTAYFKSVSAFNFTGNCYLGGNHKDANMLYDSDSFYSSSSPYYIARLGDYNSEKAKFPVDQPNETTKNEVLVGERVAFIAELDLNKTLSGGSECAGSLYAGDSTSGTLLSTGEASVASDGTGIKSSKSRSVEFSFKMPDNLTQVTAVLTVNKGQSDEYTETHTYNLSDSGTTIREPTSSDYVTAVISTNNLWPTLVKDLKVASSLEFVFDAYEQAVKKSESSGGDIHSYYVDMSGGFVNTIFLSKDNPNQTGGYVEFVHQMKNNSDCWSWAQYGVNGFYCDLGGCSWQLYGGENILWYNFNPLDAFNPAETNQSLITGLGGGDARAVAVLREHVSDADLTAAGVGTTYRTAAQLEALYPQYKDEIETLENENVPDEIKTIFDPIVDKINAIGTVTKNSGDAISAAKSAFDSIPQTFFHSSGYLPYLFKTYDPYKTAYNTLVTDESTYASLTGGSSGNVAASDALTGVLNYIKTGTTNPTPGYMNGEWAVLALARGGKITASDTWAKTYLTNLNAALIKGDTVTKATDYERVTLALSALGIDASSYNGKNLTSEYSTYDDSMLLNAKVFALLALNSKPFTSSTGDFIGGIVSAELSGGGWNLEGTGTADPDMTAMAIQALAPYYSSNSSVKTAVDKGLTVLKAIQDSSTGGFKGYSGTLSTCSTAQVVTALCALNINPAGSDWTTSNGGNPLSALLTYYNSTTGSFGDTAMAADEMATEQGAYALVAYDRYSKGENTLYNMSDAFSGGSTVTVTPAELIQAIAALPVTSSITLKNEDQVNSLWLEYQGLSSTDQAQVTNASTLTADKTRIDSLRSTVDKLSSDIWNGFNPSKLTLADKATIQSLMARYKTIDSVDQQFVQYYDSVLDAWQQIQKMEKATNTVSGSKSGSGYQANLDKSSLTGGTVTANLGNVSVSFPEKILESLENGKTLTISQQPLSDSLLKEVNSSLPTGNSLVCSFNLNLTESDGTQIHKLGGKITVTLKLTDDELAKITDASTAILYYYDSSSGKFIKMDATFDLKNKTVTFTTDHLSTFVIAQGTSVSEYSVPNPQTGDSSNGLPMEAAVLSISAFAALICLKRRDKAANRH